MPNLRFRVTVPLLFQPPPRAHQPNDHKLTRHHHRQSNCSTRELNAAAGAETSCFGGECKYPAMAACEGCFLFSLVSYLRPLKVAVCHRKKTDISPLSVTAADIFSQNFSALAPKAQAFFKHCCS